MTNSTGTLTWIPAGGNFPDGVGANCHIYQYHDKGNESQTTLIVDAGVRHVPDKPGGVLVPDISNLLRDAASGCQRLLLTHCHNDHIGAIPHWIQHGHPVPMIMASNFTLHMLQAQLSKKNIHPDQWPEMAVIQDGHSYDIGPGMRIECAAASHSVPGALSLLITTPAGTHFHSGDVKADDSVLLSDVADFDRLSDWGDTIKIDTALLDCAFAASEGYARKECDVRADILKIVRDHPDQRLVFAGSGSYAETLSAFALAAVDTGRVLVYDGSSFETNLLALQRNNQHLPYIIEAVSGKNLLMVSAENHLVPMLKPDQMLVLVGGSDAHPDGSVMKALQGRSGWWTPSAADVFVTPSGRRQAIQDMEQGLTEQGVEIIRWQNGFRDLCEGHCRREDFRRYLNMIRPETVIPTHGLPDAVAAALEVAAKEKIKAQPCYVGSIYRLGPGGPVDMGPYPDQWLHIGGLSADHHHKPDRKYGL